MKPRLAATALLVAGMFFTGSGATLAVISDTGSAAQVQYPETPLPTAGGGEQPTQQQGGEGSQPGSGEVLGESFGGGGEAPAQGGSEVLGDSAAGGSDAGEAPASAQATRQLELEGGDELPFTGFAAIPLLIVGILMLAFGMTMRRTVARTEA